MHHRRLTHTTTPLALLLVLAGQAVAAPGDTVGSEFQVKAPLGPSVRGSG